MKKIFITLFIVTISTQILSAQNLKRANSLFERRAYMDAAELYEQEDPKSQEVYEKLGDCYYYNSEMKLAALNYKILATHYSETIKPSYIYKYSQALKGTGNIEEADKWQQKYYAATNKTAAENIETKAFFEALNSTIDRPYIIKKLNANSEHSNFGTAFYLDTIVFSSSRENGNVYGWNKQPYLDLFKATPNASGELENIMPFSKNINTKMHESNAVFTKDGKTMYFTRNNYLDGKKGKDDKKITHLKIYKAEFINNEWTNITELPFNSDNYSTEHPALSPDEKQLYFSSDMPGSIGSFDLYVVNINSDGTYGTPKNLGTEINTELREQFPFISSINNLYFASDGHFGMGGLDIFKSEISVNGFSKPTNLSNIINSNLDDFGFIINEEKEIGYFSSNRDNANGIDDIYSFTQLKKYYVKGLVKNKTNNALLPNATVTLIDSENNTVSEIVVGDDAAYTLEINPNSTYSIRGSKKSYNPSMVKFSSDAKGNINKDIALLLESYEDAEKKIVEENGKIQIKINPIYFDFDRWNIREDAALELDNVVEVMKKYPTMKIEIGAHTDSRGPEEYNRNLSDKRANSVREYLVSQGIATENVKSVGYGESQPLNHCVREGICKEKEYDINRRCEFIIVN
ncbi:WD40-like Beta Propeller Repeat [Lutibacter agarilyticus]|uniref:WD40-like Beta Propeller Repeat n=1 Tax=Lutibacter agarilyticus TaxID=1109740 RepID=A0A238WHE7_9FLAO|nr:OmpA family protein [Lutibacter agarilyticus]SNR45897.1 WD40-like Beta Propeller Repeat [Lutibacter agarilyticus]